MSPAPAALSDKSRLAVLLEHFATIEDPRDVRRITHPLAEILLLVVCGTIAGCDDYDHIAAWGAAHLDFLRRHLPYEDGVPGGRWLTILMNRINPALFSVVFSAWVRGTWPDRPDFVAIDGKTSRRSHDRAAGEEPIHLVSAFATTSRLVLGQDRLHWVLDFRPQPRPVRKKDTKSIKLRPKWRAGHHLPGAGAQRPGRVNLDSRPWPETQRY